MPLNVLDRGCQGRDVQTLQHLLNTTANHRPPLRLDGRFGPNTESAVRRLQAMRGLEVDGIVGRRTWRSLGLSDAGLPAPTVSPSPTPERSVAVPSIRRVVTPTPSAPVGASAPVRLVGPPAQTSPVQWMTVAIAEKGVSEVAGAVHNQRIVAYHATTTLGAKTDEVPWCSSFVNWCLKQAGITGTNSAAAASWSSWGQELTDPRYGAIVHIRRGGGGHDRATGSSSGNHVGFLIRRTPTHVTLLGGNQGNRVKESSFPLSSYSVRSMRWPAGR
jgi:uncharacterized protein (TIGR02594 family)